MMRGPSHYLGIGTATLALTFALACTSTPSAEEVSDTDTASSTSTTGETTTSGTETSSSGDGDGDATTTDDTEGSSGECVPYVPDDCNDPNQKCMPYSVADDSIPDEMRCCALDPNPVSLGERCQIEEYDGSCLDNCPAGTVCVLDRPDELEGYCQVFCDPAAPDESCGDQQICKAFFEMIESAATVPVCMARCDPLLQDCESKGRPGWSCLPEGALSPSFLCMPPGGESPKLEYESCLLANDCEVGLACVPSSEVLGCDGLFNCCTRYCDLSEPDVCTMGNECISLESDVPGLEDVGVCADPL